MKNRHPAGRGQEATSDLIVPATDDQHSALQHLPMLEGIGPLLPGAADKRPTVGDGWPEHPGLSVAQLLAASPECVCWHIGAAPGHAGIDIDGAKAAAFCQSHGCDPYTADTWRIIRTSNTERVKLVFTVKPDQKAALVAGHKTVKIEGQELAVFSASGHQIVVLGNHYTKESNFTKNDDQYAWAGRAPADAQPMPPEWFALLTGVFCGDRPLRPATRRAVTASSTRKANAYSSGSDWSNSCQRQPCPMCGRDHSGACSISRDRDSVWCCHGETKSAPDCSKAGETVPGTDGRTWAYVRTEEHDSFGERSLFVIDRPRQPPAAAAAGKVGLVQQTTGKAAEPGTGKPITFEDRWQELEGHAAVVACSDWPVMKAVASLASKAGDLEVNRLTGRNLEQLLEQAHRAVRAKADPIAGGETFKVKTTPWAVDGLFRHGLNLLVGQSGAGKSRLAAACMAAWLRGDQTWLNLPLNGIEPERRHALIVGSDQTLEDWAITLEPVGLCKRLDAETVRIHPNLTLYGLETAVGLDADGLAMIRRWVDHHPGGMVLVDSLSSCLPPGIDEATKAAGRPVRQLQEVLGDAWGILTHHTRKGAGKEGNLGVGAGRGSGDIDAAASRVIGLGLIYKMENGVLVPQESDDRRELLSTKRGGKTLHLVVKSDATGFWSNEGDAEALKQHERQERAISNLTEAQGDVLALLDAADGWMTLRALIEGAGEEYEARGAKAATTRKVLKRLEVLGLAESVKSGSERTYRAKGEPLRGEEREFTGSLGSPTAPQGVSMAHPLARTCSPEPSEPPTGGEPQDEPPASSEPQGEPVKTQSPQQESQVSHLPLFVAHPAGSAAVLIPLGAAVEHLGSDGWRNGWTVADVVQTSSGATRYRIESGGEARNVAADQIRPCAEVK